MDSSGCITKGNKTHYTYFDVGEHEPDNLDFYRIQVKFNRDKFEQKMRTTPIPEKHKFAQKFFGMELPLDETPAEA